MSCNKIDPIILDYQNSLLRKSDVDLLQGPYWLNDRLIGFWFEYLENKTYKNRGDVLFLSPEVTQLIKMEPAEEILPVLESLDLPTKNLIILPVNDSMATESAGGSHWSLLAFEKKSSTFFHLDSGGGSNTVHARNIASNLFKILKLAKIEFMNLKTTGQNNSYDCGICVICNCEHAVNHYINRNSLKSLSLVERSIINKKRSEIHEIIMSLSKK